MRIHIITDSEPVCTNCSHYYQHYVLMACGYYAPCNCGHCGYPRVKKRKPGQDGCEHFERKENEK